MTTGEKGKQMENWGKWKLVKAGFLLGIGFIVPLLVVGAANPVVTSLSFQVMAQSAFESSEEEVVASSSFSPAEMDVTQSIELGDHREKMQNGQLRVLSSLENVGDQEASMVKVEAELFDGEGDFVYECSTMVDGDLGPGQKENFQLKCGCADNPVPDYSDLTLRVVSANSF